MRTTRFPTRAAGLRRRVGEFGEDYLSPRAFAICEGEFRSRPLRRVAQARAHLKRSITTRHTAQCASLIDALRVNISISHPLTI